MVGWHHHWDGREFEPAPGDREGQGRLASCSPWGLKESDATQQQKTTRRYKTIFAPWQQVYIQTNFFFSVPKHGPITIKETWVSFSE